MENDDLGIRREAIRILTRAESEGLRLSDYLAWAGSRSDAGRNRQPFFTELVKGVIRQRGRLDWEISKLYRGKYRKLPRAIRQIMRIGAYQILFMDRIPNYAAVDTSVKLGRNANPRLAPAVNAVLRELIRREPLNAKDIPESELPEWFSHPGWLLDRWEKQWGTDTARKLAEWNNINHGVWFRLHGECEQPDHFAELLANEFSGFQRFPDLPRYFTVQNAGQLIDSHWFSEGKITVQDPSGGFIIDLLDPHAEETIIDGCSAPGGKTAAASCRMRNTGTIYAFDSDTRRMNTLIDTLKRLNISNVQAKVKDLTDITDSSLPGAARILLDVPCSGTGVISKKPDIKWRRTESEIQEFSRLQNRILGTTAKDQRSGTIIVYSTCSLEPEENWGVVDRFLDDHPQYEIQPACEWVPEKYCDDRGALSLHPVTHGIDGGFAVRMICG